ncbi:Mediator of RNA polymerase II transcription subunit 25 [Operophtera brumata]|uniref:Mediator of RNA polymerase II transcription subunit 25 n=1 Tax=Operophtera brumata TaxID=104452 RepID=A0A0L7LH82_OPEBR|nr:Mediator of RNA polymerase II transcription subunit 25 [Operophtera brumata]
MVVNAPDSPVQAQVIFAIEATAANGAYIGELNSNYIIPTLEYFHGGALEEPGGNGSVYCIVTYRAADCIPSLPIATYGPYHTPQNVLEAVEKIQFIGGHAESKACLTEAMTTALACFEELGRSETSSHVLILCCSPPYSAYAGGMAPPGKH